MADQEKSKRIILKAKKPNGFKESERLNLKPKKADNEDDNDNDDEEDDDLLKEQEEKLQTRFIECLNSFNTNAIEQCISYLKDLPYEVINSVLTKTSGLKAPNWNYAKKVLDDYVKRKINTLEKVEIDTGQRKPKQEEKIKNYNNYEQREYDNLDEFYANK